MLRARDPENYPVKSSNHDQFTIANDPIFQGLLWWGWRTQQAIKINIDPSANSKLPLSHGDNEGAIPSGSKPT